MSSRRLLERIKVYAINANMTNTEKIDENYEKSQIEFAR